MVQEGMGPWPLPTTWQQLSPAVASAPSHSDISANPLQGWCHLCLRLTASNAVGVSTQVCRCVWLMPEASEVQY